MRIRSLDHLVLTVADVDRTVRFYESLGMRRETFGDGRVALRFGEQKLNLHRAGAEFEPHATRPAPGTADLCFLVDDLDEVAAALARADVPVELGPVARTGATAALTSLYVRDPDGNLVELSQTADGEGDAGRPYDERPDRLYTRDDLMQGWRPGADHSMTLDGRIYAYVKAHGGRAPDMAEGLAQRTHDHFIDVALADFLMRTGRPVVGVMGGSRTLPADANYRRVVHLTAALTQRGYLVVTGGGLGIMEAANLGAYLAGRSDAERDDAVDALADAPPYADDRAGYIGAEVEVRERFAPGAESLAIPTWVNPGEPISQFASHFAKYFSNSIREDGLLALATAGIVFAPGGAGTMQEIFQDAAQNADRIFGRSPMAFLDTRHYCDETGLYPALERQARRLGFEDLLSVGDEPEQILARFPAGPAPPPLDGMAPEMLVRRMRNAR